MQVDYYLSQPSEKHGVGVCVNGSFQARVGNLIPGLIHAHAINTKPNRIFSFFFPFPIPWGVTISKRSTEIIT